MNRIAASRVRRAVRRGLGGLLLLAAACTPTEGPNERQPAPVVRPPPAPAVDPRPPPMEEVLWTTELEGRGFVFPRVHGIDPQTRTAWVSLSNTNQVPAKPDLFWELIEVDLATGRTGERWRETVGGSNDGRRKEFGMVWPLADDDADIGRLAAIARRAHTHDGNWGGPVVVSPDGGIAIHHRWGDDPDVGDWLIMRDREGKGPVRLDVGFTAAYSPAFSPDGSRIAFTACKKVRGQGCVYGVYVKHVGGELKKIEGLGHCNQLHWSPDGDYLYVIDTDGQVPFFARWQRGTEAAEKILPDLELRSLGFAFGPAGHNALLGGYFGEPGEQTAVYRWVSLPDLTEQARFELYKGTGVEALRDDGVALVHDQVGLVAVDPFRNRQGKLSGLYQGADASHWDPDGRIILGHTTFDSMHTGTFALVRVDPEAMLVDPLEVEATVRGSPE